jgi:hypothetical protein
MSKQAINKRLVQLESSKPERPVIAIFQDYDDPNIWHENTRAQGGDPGEPMTWDQVKKKYSNHDLIRVTYTDKWRVIPSVI